MDFAKCFHFERNGRKIRFASDEDGEGLVNLAIVALYVSECRCQDNMSKPEALEMFSRRCDELGYTNEDVFTALNIGLSMLGVVKEWKSKYD